MRYANLLLTGGLTVFLVAGCDTVGGTMGLQGEPGPAGPAGPEGPQGPSFILALGSIESDGTLIRAAAVDGLTVGSVRTTAGKYSLTISGTGAFSGVVAEQIIVGLTAFDGQEDNTFAATVLSISADSVVLGFTVVDVDGGGAGTLVDDKFYFQVFLIP
ncbi:hypothetical protein B7486_00490 [cyanobacterium TDX16]|nr:hypothetical protein B7486_00490 [cyanobacterium TDX16]